MNFQRMYCDQGEHDWNFITNRCLYCGISYDDHVKGNSKNLIVCECGAEKLKHPGHSEWCKKFRKVL
jgi:hypothetical protein